MLFRSIFFVVDDFKYLVQGGRVSPAVGKIGDILDIKVILTMREGRIEPYRKNRGISTALRNIQRIAQSGETARLGAIYVGNQKMFDKCKSLVNAECEAALNLIVSSHVGPNATGIAIECASEKPFRPVVLRNFVRRRGLLFVFPFVYHFLLSVISFFRYFSVSSLKSSSVMDASSFSIAACTRRSLSSKIQ